MHVVSCTVHGTQTMHCYIIRISNIIASNTYTLIFSNQPKAGNDMNLTAEWLFSRLLALLVYKLLFIACTPFITGMY